MSSPSAGLIRNVKPFKVAFVQRPAHKREFLLTKHNGENEMEELLQIVAETEADNEKDLVSVLEERGLDEKAIKVAKTIARLGSAYSDQIDADVFKSVAQSLGFDITEKVEKPIVDGATITKTEVENLPDGLREKVESLVKSQDEMAETVKDLGQIVRDNQDEKLLASYADKAKGLDNIAGTPEELGDLLKSVAEVKGDETATKVLEALTAANAAAEIGREVGSSARTTGSNAEERLLAKSRELTDGDSGLTKGQAFDRAMDMLPDDAEEYRQSFVNRS